MARWQFFANSQMGFQISAKWKGLGRHERISLTDTEHEARSMEPRNYDQLTQSVV